MPITKEIQLFHYSELSDSAKQTARDWWLSCRDETDYEGVIDDFREIVERMGIDFKTRPVTLMSGNTRYDPCIWYNLGYSQSDFAAFEGTWRYVKGMAKAVKEYAPQDKALHRIASEATALFAKGFYRDAFTVKYSDYYGTQVEPAEFSWQNGPNDRAKEFKELARDLGRWLYDRLREQDEYLCSDEQVSEAIECNGYTFRADGKRED